MRLVRHWSLVISHWWSSSIVFMLLIFLMVSCRHNETSSTAEVTTEKQAVRPDFSADTAYAFVQQQVAFGPRVPGSKAQQKCAEYIQQKLKQYDASVVTQQTEVVVYNGKTVPCINIIGSYNPEAKRRLLICTHWDSRPFADQDDQDRDKPILAADDAGSGVAVLLEMARQLKQKKAEVGIDLLFLDVEDYGQPEYEADQKQGDFYCLGTQYWSKNPHVSGYKAENGILLDMVGAKGATFTYEGVSMQYAPDFMKQVWRTADVLGYSNFFQKEITAQIIDDHYYINELARIPTIDIIHRTYSTRSGFPAHWHTHKDNMDIIDKLTLKAVGETVLATAYIY